MVGFFRVGLIVVGAVTMAFGIIAMDVIVWIVVQDGIQLAGVVVGSLESGEIFLGMVVVIKNV